MPLACKACRLGVFNQCPVDAEVSFQALEVCEREAFPSLLCRNLALPYRSKLRNLSDHSCVFMIISQLTSFCERTEAVVVLARLPHVVCADGKIRVGWGVLPNPIERLQPLVV